MAQENVFLKGEGDQWFKRNLPKLSLAAKGNFDAPLKLIELYGLNPKKVLEIGCSNGWRLHEIAERYGSQCVGIEPGSAAVKEGTKKYPELTLKRGIASGVPVKGAFDLVIVYFVLHWVSRRELHSSLKEIDRTVADGGYLIVGDFAPDHPSKTRYHHLPKKDVWTFKQDYAKAFTATSLYEEVARLTFNHDRGTLEQAHSSERGFTSLLRKSSTGYYSVTDYHAKKKSR